MDWSAPPITGNGGKRPGTSAVPKVVLRGATKQETTSQQALQQAKDEREKRRLARELPRAALRIQSVWRGHVGRAAARKQLQSEWIQRYGSLAAQPTISIDVLELETKNIPLALLALLPPLGTRQRAALETGAILPPFSGPETSVLRGLFALLLRHLSAAVPSCPAAAAAAGSSQAAAESSALKREGGGSDAPNGHGYAGFATAGAAAAARLGLYRRVATLATASITGSSADVLGQTAAARVLALLTAPSNASLLPAGLSLSLAELPMLPQAAARLAKAAAAAAAGTSQQQKQLCLGLGNIVTAVLNLVDVEQAAAAAAVNAGNEKVASQETSRACGALELLVREVLPAPKLLQSLSGSAAAMARLQEPALFVRMAERCDRAGGGGGEGKSADVAAAPALQLLEVLTGLLLENPGKKEGKERSLAGDAACVEAYASAAGALLSRLSPHATTPEALEAAVLRFADGRVAARLQAALPLPCFCELYSSLLEAADGVPQGGAAVLRLLSALAFSIESGSASSSGALLPQLWRWLAATARLPREIAAQTTRFEISSLPLGVRSVAGEALRPITLFCRVLAHFLVVVDDVEFYQEQKLLSLAQLRAVAASLVALLFRSHLPKTSTRTSSSALDRLQAPTAAASAAPLTPAGRVLLSFLPRTLRALFDRDVRRKFCAEGLWLEPYRQVAAEGGAAGDVSGAAVLQSLLQANREEGEDGGQQPPRAAAPAGLAALLLQAPQCIPFEQRVAVFRGLVALDKKARCLDLPPIEGGPRPREIVIRRARVLEDALAALSPGAGPIRGPIHVSFVDSHGLLEAGIDMGGLTKELLSTVSAALLDPNQGLGVFAATPDGALYPHPLAPTLDQGQALLTLAGTVLGKALYEGILLQAPLAPFFVARLQGRLPTLDDLAALDPEVYRSLTAIKRYTGDAADLGLDFTVESDVFGSKIIEELVLGGSEIPVSTANKLQYIHLVADWHLRKRLGVGAAAFSAGLSRALPPAWLRLFSAREVNQLLGGGEGGDVDVEDMKRHAVYSGGYTPISRTVQLFWKVVTGMSAEDRRALMRFVTSSSRAPLGGFKHMEPPLTIHKVDCGSAPLAFLGGKDVDRLPSASTCVNTLKLPNFKRESTLREKLLYAIRAGAGFDLS